METIKLSVYQIITIPSCIKKWLFENTDAVTKTKLLSDALFSVCSAPLQEIKEKSDKVNRFFAIPTGVASLYIRSHENISIKIPVDIKSTLVSCSTSLEIPQAEVLRAAIEQILIEKNPNWETIIKQEIQEKIKEKERQHVAWLEEEKRRREEILRQRQETYNDDDEEEDNRNRRYKYPYIGEYYAPVKWIGSRIRWAKDHGRPVRYNRYLEDAAYRYDLDADELHEKFQEYTNAGKRYAKYRRSCYR